MILSNQVRCHVCGDTPYSSHVHDFKYCKCGNIAVDGGMDYLRRVGGEKGYDHLSINMKIEIAEDCLDQLKDVDIKADSGIGSWNLAAIVINTLSTHQEYSFLTEATKMPDEVMDLVETEVEASRQRSARINTLGILCAVARALRDAGYEKEMCDNTYVDTLKGYKVGEKHPSSQISEPEEKSDLEKEMENILTNMVAILQDIDKKELVGVLVNQTLENVLLRNQIEESNTVIKDLKDTIARQVEESTS